MVFDQFRSQSAKFKKNFPNLKNHNNLIPEKFFFEYDEKNKTCEVIYPNVSYQT